MLITMGVGLYTTRAILSILGVENFGIYNVVGGIVSLISFLNTALANATTRFLTYEIGVGDNVKLKKTFSASLSINILIGFIIVLLGVSVGPWYIKNYLVIPKETINSAIVVFYLSLAYCFINISQIPYTALIIAREKMNIYAYLAVVEALLKLVIVFVLLLYPDKQRLVVYAWLMFITQVTTLLLYRIYCLSKYKESRFSMTTDRNIIFPIFKFALLDVYGSLCSIGWYQGIALILNFYFGPIINAAYGICNQVINVVYKFIDSYLTAVKPQITKAYARHEYLNMISLMQNSSKLSFVLILLIAAPLFTEMDLIFDLWLEKVPVYSVWLTRYTLIFLLVSSLLVPLNLSIHATGHMKEISFKTGSLYLIAIPILFYTLRYVKFPFMAVFFYIILQVLAIIINLFILKKYIIELSINNYLKSVLKPCMIILTIVCCVIYTENIFLSQSWIRFIFEGLTSTLVIFFSSFYIVLSSKQRGKLIHYVRNKMN